MLLLYTFTFIIIFTFSNNNIKCQQSSDNSTLVELNKSYNGTLSEDYSWAFYKLIIPEGLANNSKNLVFKVKEPDSALVGKDDFSDPDIYVSTVIILKK